MAGGVSPGRCDQSGSLLRTDASTCDTVSPVNTGCPVSILEQHHAERPEVAALVDGLPSSLSGLM